MGDLNPSEWVSAGRDALTWVASQTGLSVGALIIVAVAIYLLFRWKGK